jgi:hypothetical protein
LFGFCFFVSFPKIQEWGSTDSIHENFFLLYIRVSIGNNAVRSIRARRGIGGTLWASLASERRR